MPTESGVNGAAGGAEDSGAERDAAAGERHVGGDDDVAGRGVLDDPVVGDVGALRHDDRLDHRIARGAEAAVGDEGDDEVAAAGDAEDFVLHRAGVGIDEDLRASHC